MNLEYIEPELKKTSSESADLFKLKDVEKYLPEIIATVKEKTGITRDFSPLELAKVSKKYQDQMNGMLNSGWVEEKKHETARNAVIESLVEMIESNSSEREDVAEVSEYEVVDETTDPDKAI